MEKVAVSFKIKKELMRQLRAAAAGHYAPTMTAIVERGIELALREIEKKAKR
jgi:uncharacterized protein YfbU (UPF0304 family)